MLFVDSTDPQEIAGIYAWGVASGVTTNPLIFARESPDADMGARIKEIAAVSRGPISVELMETELGPMLDEATRYDALVPERICIKVPFTETGLVVGKKLVDQGRRTNVTCVMSFNQGYLAALGGAAFVSIFSGRVRDTGYDVRPTIAALRDQLDREGLESRIIVGSIRHPMDVTEALAAGAHIVTVSPAILRKMLHHPKTDEAIVQFNDAWKNRA